MPGVAFGLFAEPYLGLLRDTFNERTSVSILSHTSDSGVGYTKHFGASYASGDVTVDGSLKRIYGAGTGASFFLSNAVPSSADYSVSADFYIVTSTGNASIWARAEHQSGSGEDGYQVRLVTGSQWELRRVDNGSATLLDSHASDMPTAGGAAVRIVLTVEGSSLTVTANGTEIMSATDATYTAVGRVGFRFSGPFSSTTGVHLDNLSASYIEEEAEEEGGGGESPTSYAMITHREPMVPPALPSLGAALSTYTDPYFGCKVTRLTDATLDPATNTPITGANGTGQGFTTASSGDTQCISADGGNLGDGFYRIWIQALAGTDYIYRVDATGADLDITREPPSTNNPGDGTGMYLSGITGEPEWSKTDGNILIGRSGSILKSYNFATDAYSTIKDISTIGVTTLTGTVTFNGTASVTGSGTSFTTELKPGYQVTVGAVHCLVKSITSNTAFTAMATAASASGTGTAYRWPKTAALSSDGQAYGNSIGFVSVSDEDTEGTYGDAHGGRVSARWGGALQDNHYIVAYWDQTNIAGTQVVWDQQRQEIGDGTTMTPIPDAALVGIFDQNWGGLGANITTTNPEQITVAANSGKFWPEQGRVKIDSEEALYIKTSETSLWLHTRGYNSTTPATHSSGATVTLRGLNSHSQQFDLSGRYMFITRSFAWNDIDNGTYTSIFWDTNDDSFDRLSDPDAYSGHVSMGYATYYNPPANADALDWQKHDIATPNTNQALLPFVSRPTNSFVGDHTSTHNFDKTGGPYPFLSGTYRFATDARNYVARVFREYDDMLLFVSTAGDGIVWRAVQHRTFGSADLLLSGTWTTNGSTTISGSSGAATSQLVAGDKIAINKESFVVVSTPNDNSIVVDHSNVAGNVSGQTIYAFSKATSGFGFWYLPRASVCRNGRFAVYTSNWQGGLGVLSTPADNSNHWRSDAFVVQFNVETPTAPTITVGPASTSVSGSSSTITSTTSTPTDVRIFFGATTDYGSAITGTVARSSTTNTITGTGTSFTSALTRGDFITISGAIYQVHEVVSNTSIRVQPPPGVTDSGLTCIKNNVVTNYNLLTAHSNAITPVSAGHHYKVYHRDSAGQQVASSDGTLS